MANNNTLGRTQRKLERLELIHLRAHAADLQTSLDQALSELQYLQESAEFWNDYAMQLQDMQADDNFTTHRAVGITKTGETMVVALS